MLTFALIMIVLHVIGTPATYAYLFFWKYGNTLKALQEQEIRDAHKAKLEEEAKYTQQHEVSIAQGAPRRPRLVPGEVLPGFMLKLTGGYEYRTYWFEIFETLRKVLLVGIPSVFPERGGVAQMFWGLLVCFATFGAYMMYTPFIEDSDDQLSQLAQLQIFLTLVSSLALRATPPSAMVGQMVTVVLFLVPLIGIALETPLLGLLGTVLAKLRRTLAVYCVHLKPPPVTFTGSGASDAPATALTDAPATALVKKGSNLDA